MIATNGRARSPTRYSSSPAGAELSSPISASSSDRKTVGLRALTRSFSPRRPARASCGPDQSVCQCEEHELGARLEPQLAHDVCAVCIDGPDRDKELLADLLVRVSECEQVEDVALPVGDRLQRRHAVGDDELRAEIGIDVAL